MAEYLLSYELNGKAIVCSHCGHTFFTPGSTLLNTTGLTMMGLDWADDAATTLICKQCGAIRWFFKPPKVIRRSPLSGAITP